MLLPSYEVHAGRGPYALLLHGFLSSRAQWLPNLDALAAVCRPVVVELFGHGRSPAPPHPEDYAPERYVAAFERIRQTLGIADWFLIGQSLGAGLTLRYALTHPARVRAHLLTNSSTAFSTHDWLRQVRPSTDKLIAAVRRDGAAALDRVAVHPKNARRVAPEYHRALCADAALHDPLGAAYTARYTSLADPIAVALLKTNRVPSLLVCGTQEARFVPRRRFAERSVPGLEVAEVDAGHAVNLEAPEHFNRLATAFLARHAASVSASPSPDPEQSGAERKPARV